MTVRKVLIVTMLLALFGCAGPEAETGAEQTIVTGSSGGLFTVSRIIDEEAKVVCWVFTGYYKGGISCLPLNETGLDQ